MIKKVQSFLIIAFDDKLAKEHETYELVNDEKDGQTGKLVNKWKSLWYEMILLSKLFTCHSIAFPKFNEKI